MKPNVETQLRTFGRNMSRIRNAQGLTQEKLAEDADLNNRTIQKIEAGQTNILITTAARIRKALDCEWNNLMRF